MTKIAFILILTFFSISANSQKVRIIDETDLQPIADVFIYSKQESSLADENGIAELKYFAPD